MRTAVLLFAALGGLFAVAARATPAGPAPAPAALTLTLRDHRFIPDTLTAPAGVRIAITLINLDGAREEFDSSDLGVEEDVTPRAHIRFTIGPLKPGSYDFMGEAHADTAHGKLVVTAPAG